MRASILATVGLLLIAAPARADYNSSSGLFTTGSVALSADQLNAALATRCKISADACTVTARGVMQSLAAWLGSISDRFAQRVNLADYVTDKTCGTDMTTRVQAAVDALSTAGGIIDVPSGCYKFGQINITSTIYFHGLGTSEYQAQFQPTTATTNMLVITGGPSFKLDGIYFNSPSFVRTAGAYVDAYQVYRLRMRDFRMDNYYRGIRLNNATAFVIEAGFFWHPTPASSVADGSAVLMGDRAGGMSQAYVGQGTLRDLFISSQQNPDTYSESYQPTTAIDMRTADDIRLDGIYMGYQGANILMRPGAGGVAGQFVTNVYATGLSFDTARVGLFMIPGASDAAVAHVSLAQSLLAVMHSNAGVSIDATTGPVTDISIIDNKIINNTGQYGLVTTGSKLNGLSVHANTFTNDGIAIALNGGTNIAVTNNVLGALDASYGPGNVTALQVATGVSGRALNNKFGSNSSDIINNSTSFFAAFNDPPNTAGQVATVGATGLAVSGINIGVAAGSGNRAVCTHADGSIYAASGASCP